MFSGLGTLGKWLGISLVIFILLGAVVGYHPIFAALGNLIHQIHGGVQTTIHHAKHGG